MLFQIFGRLITGFEFGIQSDRKIKLINSGRYNKYCDLLSGKLCDLSFLSAFVTGKQDLHYNLLIWYH